VLFSTQAVAEENSLKESIGSSGDTLLCYYDAAPTGPVSMIYQSDVSQSLFVHLSVTLVCHAWMVQDINAAEDIPLHQASIRDLRSFEIRFDFESNFRFGIRFVVMIRFEIFESSAPSIVLCKETIGGG